MSAEEIESKKRKMAMVMKKHSGVDRLSGLPDSLLIHILSFVGEPAGFSNRWSFSCEITAEVKKTAVTSVLSKRWRNLWAELPVLAFQEESRNMVKISKFVAMVSGTLNIRTAKYLEKLYLKFRFSQIWSIFVDRWLVFASKSKTKVVSLMLPRKNNTVGYALPDMFYRNSSLTELQLAYCSVAPQRAVAWRCLSRLQFCMVELGEDVIENILGGCPVLYTLSLHYCWGFNRLNINSPSVGKLRVWDNEVNPPLLEISAPYIQYLDIKSVGEAKNRNIRVRNIRCVVKAVIDIRPSVHCVVSIPEDRSDAKEWVEATLHIPELRLTDYLFWLISEVVEEGWQIPQSKRVSLALDTSYFAPDEATILAMISLLESSPQLEKFEVSINLRQYDPLHHEPLRKDDFSCCDYSHLKTVKIECYAEDGNDNPIDIDIILLLARTLLRRATVLAKMVILIGMLPEWFEFKKIGEEVNSYRRSSKQAQLLILPRYN